MSLKLEFIEEDLLSGKCCFFQSDYTLEYSVENYFKKSNHFLLIYDTLTVVFDSFSRKFISVDAYTNKEIWVLREKIALPESYKSGSLLFSEGFEDTDRYSFNFDPIYEYSKDGILKINLSINNQNALFFQIAKDLFVGIEEGKIISFIFPKLYFA